MDNWYVYRSCVVRSSTFVSYVSGCSLPLWQRDSFRAVCVCVGVCVCVCVCVCVPAVKHPYFLIRVCAVSAVNFQTANLIPDLRGGRATSAISGVTHLRFTPASSLLFTFSSETLLDWMMTGLSFFIPAEHFGCGPSSVPLSPSTCSYNSSFPLSPPWLVAVVTLRPSCSTCSRAVSLRLFFQHVTNSIILM